MAMVLQISFRRIQSAFLLAAFVEWAFKKGYISCWAGHIVEEYIAVKD